MTDDRDFLLPQPPQRPAQQTPPPQPPPYGQPTVVQPTTYNYASYAGPPATPAPPTNGFAIAALVLGILWLWWLGSILAVIFGHVALNQIERDRQAGKGLAVAGLVLGYVGLGFAALFFIAAIFAAAGGS